MRKPNTTCVPLFPTHWKFPISPTDICFGYYFPTQGIFYPSAYTIWCLSSTFLFLIRIKEWNSAIISCSYSTYQTQQLYWLLNSQAPKCSWESITFKICVQGRFKSKIFLDLLGSRSHRFFFSVVHSRIESERVTCFRQCNKANSGLLRKKYLGMVTSNLKYVNCIMKIRQNIQVRHE